LLSFPVYFNLDSSDDLLNPVRGSRLVARVTPYTDTITSAKFLKSYASYSHYLRFGNKWLPVIANRAALGSIVGEARDGVPADVRFYAGGGGSIRGYPYQKVGPMNDDDPVGGASLIELSTELRFKATESIGFVVFMDGGSAFESSYPDFGETLRWGAGAGVRYYTPIGPLRLDVAFPLNPADGMNDSMQLYLSIGQAF
ncbi:MAG: autotransporter assembly complex family protein, partial [Syntrophobacteraceae bacterium]